MGLGSDVAGVVSGLINSGRSLPTIDIGALLSTIQGNQTANAGLINGLTPQVQQLLAQYTNGTNAAGSTYQGATNQIGNTLLNNTSNLYGPNSPAVQATLAALKQNDYSTLPGTLNNLKSSLAATGGLQRGGAATAIQKAVQAPATAFSGQAATVQGQQLTAQQQNVQQALNKIASMDDTTAQQLFGMSRDQATQILTTGNQALQTQLSDLINNNNQATNATLGAEGVSANNAYQNAVTRNAQQAGIVNGLTNLGVNGAIDLASMGFGGGGAGGAADTSGAFPTAPALPNPAANVPGMGAGGSGLNLY